MRFNKKKYSLVFWVAAYGLFLLFSSCSASKNKNVSYFGKEIVITGNSNKAALLNHPELPWFLKNYSNYQPNDALIKKIALNKDSLSFLIFGGTWCSDTKRELPAFFKVMDEVGITQSQYQLWLLDAKKKDATIKPEIWKIEFVPTFIVLKNGKEIGRIIEKPTLNLEQDLLQMIELAK